MDNIKSSYFLELIFRFVDESQKLKLIRYNKNLQKNINISIINYKHFTGKYIIYESNGIAKEYNGKDNSLIFEGEYLNGKRHGKGKEYMYTGKIEFEGEYLNGQRNGKGKEYNGFGQLIYEGEYLNGKKNGKGKEYYKTMLIFEGEYFNNKEWIGNGYAHGELIYKLNNDMNGKGRE